MVHITKSYCFIGFSNYIIVSMHSNEEQCITEKCLCNSNCVISIPYFISEPTFQVIIQLIFCNVIEKLLDYSMVL